jgi:biotin carboxylase
MKTNGSLCQFASPRALKRVVLAGRFKLGAKVAERFRKLGWEVHTITSDHDVHAAAAETEPHAVLLLEDPGTGAESGYLACAKLRQMQPDLKVVVVGPEWTPERERFAEFVGATFATEDDVDELVNAVV